MFFMTLGNYFNHDSHARPFPESDHSGFVGQVIKDCSVASEMLGDDQKRFGKIRCQS